MSSDSLHAIDEIHGIYTCEIPNVEDLAYSIITGFNRLQESPRTERSHYFGGRYENIYPKREEFPEMEPLIAHVLDCAKRLLNTKQELRLGFWFNQMSPGHSTTLHTHEDMEELLSGVFYLQVPANSGDIVFRLEGTELRFTPEAGQMLLFPPELPHEVEINHSEKVRLSVAFNIGPDD